MVCAIGQGVSGGIHFLIGYAKQAEFGMLSLPKMHNNQRSENTIAQIDQKWPLWPLYMRLDNPLLMPHQTRSWSVPGASPGLLALGVGKRFRILPSPLP